MIQLRQAQPTLWHKGLAKDIEDLWEPWMKEADRLLDDAALLETVYEAQGQRHRHSRTLGRLQTPAEIALRLLILKHVRNWGYDTLEREVRANLVYRAFTRIGDGKVPDAKTLARIGQVIGPKVIRDLHERLVAMAREHGVVKGRKLRVDTTVVETNIHYPTDSSLLGDGARVLTRTMKKMDKKVGGLKPKIRDRMRAVKKRAVAIAFGHAPHRAATGRTRAVFIFRLSGFPVYRATLRAIRLSRPRSASLANRRTHPGYGSLLPHLMPICFKTPFSAILFPRPVFSFSAEYFPAVPSHLP